MKEVKAGDTVMVRQWNGSTVKGIVDMVFDDVKNGRPGIDYTVPDATSEWERYKWAYSYQIESVL